MCMEDCYARAYCSKFRDESHCNYGCVAYHQLQTVYKLSNMPKRYRYELKLVPSKEDKKKFVQLRDEWTNVVKYSDNGITRYKHAVLDKVGSGAGLYLWSKEKGNGKTAWACKIMQSFFRAVAVHNNLRTRAVFVNVPTFLEEMRQNMNNPSQEHEAFVRKLSKVDLVVFDEIGAESPSPWVREKLYVLINQRDVEGLSSIFTSNLSLGELGHEEALGDRIASRISGACDVIEFTGRDKRLETKGSRFK